MTRPTTALSIGAWCMLALAMVGLLLLVFVPSGTSFPWGAMILILATLPVFALIAALIEVSKQNTLISAQRKTLEDEQRKALTASCCSAGASVAMTQKDGGIQTFVFSNPEYAERFRNLNANNLLEAGRRVARSEAI